MVLIMEPFVVCKYCGEKNSQGFSKCRKCKRTLPRQWESSNWEHVFQNSLKRCHSCNARIKAEAKYCPKCGQKQVQEETKSLPHSQRKVDIEFTREHKSLERAIQGFDKLFADQAKQPGASQNLLFIQKKTWYFNQKERFLQRNISNDMFYHHLKSLKEYLNSIAIIPELIEPETYSPHGSEEEIVLDTHSLEIENEDDIQQELESPIVQKVELSKETPQKALELQDLSVIESSPEIPNQESSTLNITDVNSSQEITSETDQQVEHLGGGKQSLFSFLQYQVKDLIFEQEAERQVVRIIPYTGSIKEIKVTFNQNQVKMEGCLIKPNLPKIDLKLKTEGEPRQASWEDPWRDISLIGEENVLKRLQMRSEIADQLVSLGTVEIKVESQIKGELCFELSCNETEEAIKVAYSLIKDLRLFFEISLY